MVPKSVAQEKPKRSAYRKKWLRVFWVSLLSVLTLEFALYFGSNLFFGSILRKKLNESFNGVYELDFNRVHLSLIRRGIFLDGIVMKPLHPERASAEQVLFELTIDQVAITGLWYALWEKELQVREITLDRPNFQAVASPLLSPLSQDAATELRPRSPVFLFENELKKSITKLPVSGVKINKLRVDHAQVFFLNFLSQHELLAKNASFEALEMYWVPNQAWNSPFNARGFEFELENASYQLPDGIHRITSKRVLLSSLEGTLDLQQFRLIPDRTRESDSYYSLDLEELQLQQVNLNQAFMTSTLDLEELILESPHIEVVQAVTRPTSATSIEGDLHAFIRKKLHRFSIKELSIRNGSFLRKEKEDSLRNRIQLEQLDLNMADFYLGEDSLRKQAQFFYGSDASLVIGQAQLFLSDGVHVLKGENLQLSTFKNELSGTKIQLIPRKGETLKARNQPTYQFDLPEFTFENVDLKKWYRQGNLEIESLSLQNPQLTIRKTKSPSLDQKNDSFLALLNGLVNEVAIQNFQLVDGTLILNEQSGEKSTDLDLGRYSVALEKLQLHPSTLMPFQEQVEFDEVLLRLYDYRLKLRDNLHEFLAKELAIDSRKELLEIKNLSIHPAEPTQVREQLQMLGKTSAVDFKIPQFRARGIGLKEALFDQQLRLNHLELTAPIFQWSTYRSKESKASENALRSAEDLKTLLLGYFEDIQIDSVTLSDAKVRYENKVKEAVTKFEEDQLFFKLKNFAIHHKDSLNGNRTLFSDEVNLTFNSYSFSLAGGKYLVDTDYLNYNSRTRTMDFEKLRLLPGKVGDRRLNFGFNFPKVALRGVNVEEFIFDNVLNLEKLEINGGEIALGVDRQVQAASKRATRSGNPTLQRTVEQIHIDTISTSNATLQLNYLDQTQSKKAIQTGFGLYISQFDLDSLRVRTQDFSKTYQGVNLGLSNFEFELPDSVHTLKFEAFGFGDDQEELVVSGLTIHPKNQVGTSGKPVVDGKIERVVFKKNSLLDMLTTKKVDLREVKVQNPVFSIYLDSLPTPFKPRFGSSTSRPEAAIHSILLQDLLLENGEFVFFSKSGVPLSNQSFPEVDARLEQLGIDLLTMEKLPTWKELLPKTKFLGLSNYQAYIQDSTYRVQVDYLQFLDQSLQVKGIQITPREGIYGHLIRVPFQQEVLTSRVEQLEIQGVEIQKLVQEGLFKSENLQVNGATVALFRDKRKPMDPNAYQPLPQYFMQHAPVNLDLASLQFKDSRLQYWEFGEKSTVPGTIAFQNIELNASPFHLRKNGAPYPVSSFQLGISGQVSDSSRLSVKSQLFFEKDNPMEVDVTLTRFAFSEAEDLLSKTAFVRPLGGGVTSGTWNFRLDEQQAVGTMTLGYKDLKFQFLDSLTLEPGKGKLKVYTLLANLWAKKSNPGKGSNSLRTSEIFRLRDTQRSMVNAWWKATYVGLKNSIGFGKAKAQKIAEKKRKTRDGSS